MDDVEALLTQFSKLNQSTARAIVFAFDQWFEIANLDFDHREDYLLGFAGGVLAAKDIDHQE